MELILKIALFLSILISSKQNNIEPSANLESELNEVSFLRGIFWVLKILASFILLTFVIIVGVIVKSNIEEKNEEKFKIKKIIKLGEQLNFKYIFTIENLRILCEEIKQLKIDTIGLDTEYFKGDKYKGRLSLIQLNYKANEKNYNYVLDILFLTEENFQETKNLLESFLSSNIIKVIHSAYNDKEWILEEFGILTNNIYDTQEAYSIMLKKKVVKNKDLNIKNRFGLEVLLLELLGISIDKNTKKNFQLTNWLQRPLTNEQLSYASFDSMYLIDLKNKIEDEKKINLSDFYCNENLDKKKEDRILKKANNYFEGNITKTCDNTEMHRQLYFKLVLLIDCLCKKLDLNMEKFFSFKVIYKISLKKPKIYKSLMTYFSGVDINNEIFNKESEIIISILNEINLFDSNVNEYMNFQLNEDLNKDVENKNIKELNWHEIKQIKRDVAIQKFKCKSPIYENCKMLSPDGEHLCFCDNKKMNWYISRGLAKLEEGETSVFRLTFIPNGVGCIDTDNKSSEFYTTTRENICVVCGNSENYMRFHIVPVCYRQFLPHELKAHKSHDVILLCPTCHEEANKIFDLKKKELSEKYNVPLSIFHDYKENISKLSKTINTIVNLLKNLEKMPIDHRKKLLEDIYKFLIENINVCELKEFYTKSFPSISFENLENYFNKSIIAISNNQLKFDLDGEEIDIINHLEKAKKFNIKELQDSESKKNLHGKYLLEKISDKEEFIKLWRIYFVEKLEPKFLPSQWRIEHQCVRTFGLNSAFKISK